MRKGETLDEALERSDFDEIAQVLNAMRENDDELSDIIQTLAVEKGRTGGFDESHLRNKFEVLGPQISLSELSSSICVRLVEELRITWDMRYGQLIAYKQVHGHCHVPRGWKENPELANWCNNQRVDYIQCQLSPNRTEKLEELGFVWRIFEALWEEMFAALTSYKQEYSDCNVPAVWKDNPPLGIWCNAQRNVYRKNELPPDRVKRLEQIGFEWNPLAAAWEEMFAELTAFKQIHDDCNVPWQSQLGRWCAKQRSLIKINELPADRIERLKGLGFVLDPLAALWEGNFAELTAYKEAHGNCNVPKKDNPKLESWCKTQRTIYWENKLSPGRIKRLEDLGFAWDPLVESLEEMFAALAAYKQTHGDCNVPAIWKDNPNLGIWCTTRRKAFRNNKLSPDQINRLEDLGFGWDPLAAAWEEMFGALIAYKQAHGDCNVPQRWENNPGLGMWCQNQKSAYKKNYLSPDRVKCLEDLGFEWNPLEVAWEEMFAALTAYKKIHGDCNVPQGWKDNPPLANWCASQRTRCTNGKLSPDRINRLEDLGFRFGVSAQKKN
jgi:hypothetical protein